MKRALVVFLLFLLLTAACSYVGDKKSKDVQGAVNQTLDLKEKADTVNKDIAGKAVDVLLDRTEDSTPDDSKGRE